MKIIDNNFINYILIGVLNTMIGFGSIMLLMSNGFSPELSNLMGYLIGICFSFILNKRHNFKTKDDPLKEFVKFFTSMGIAYISNFLVLVFLYRVLYLNKYLSQIVASGIYVMVGYMLSKAYVFKRLKHV